MFGKNESRSAIKYRYFLESARCSALLTAVHFITAVRYYFSGTYQKRQKHQSYATGVLNVAAASVDSAGVALVRAFYDS